MISKIVLGTDGSDDALNATRLAALIANTTGAEVVAVNTFDLATAVAPLTPEAIDVTEFILETAEGTQDIILERTGEVLSEAGCAYRSIADEGDVAESLLQVAKEEQADLIVIGAHRVEGFEERLFGTVTDGVTHRAICPVLVAHGETQAIRRILVGFDGSGPSERALVTAAHMAQAMNAVLVVLHVLDKETPYPGIAPSETDAAGYALLVGKAVLERVEELLFDINVTREAIQEAGKTIPVLMEVAATRDIDLIAIGSHGPGAFQRLFGHGHSFEIVHQARVPVLLVRT